MRSLAILHTSALNEFYQTKVLMDPRYRWYSLGGYRELTVDVAPTDYSSLQYVSLSKDGKLLGYLAAELDRGNGVVKNLCVFKDLDNHSSTFLIDLVEFILELLNDFRSITWMPSGDNPSLPFYEKVVERFCGGILFRQKDYYRSENGSLSDRVAFYLTNSTETIIKLVSFLYNEEQHQKQLKEKVS